MTRFAYAQNNFVSGELSPKLLGRSDLKEYISGAQELKNNIPLASGGYTRRPGSQFIKDITADFDSNFPVEIIEFTPNRGSLYLVAVGKKTATDICDFKVYKQGTSYPITLTECTVNIDGAIIASGLLNLFTYGINTLNELQYAQSADLLFLTHSSKRMEPLALVRTADTVFELTSYDRATAYVNERTNVRVRRMPFQPENNNKNFLLSTSGGSPGFRTLTASGPGFAPFTSEWIGTWVRLWNGATEMWGFISAYTSSTVVSLTFDNPAANPSNITNEYRWAWGSWSRKMGYPGTVSLWQQRIMFGGTIAEPSTVWVSNIGNLFLILNRKLHIDASSDVSDIGYFGPTLDSDAFSFTIASDFTGSISMMSADKYLKIGTDNGEHVVTPVNGVFGPGKLEVSNQSFFGSSPIRPARLYNSLIFCSISGKKIQEVTFSEENASSTERELSILADHLVYHNRNPSLDSTSSSKFTKIVYQKDRKCVWVLNSNGGLSGVVNNPSGGVLAWFKCEFGGKVKHIESVAPLPSPDGGTTDGAYIVVNRTINGDVVKYIERIGEDLEQDSVYGEFTSNQRDLALCSDSCIVVSSATIGGGVSVIPVGHLIGETVVVTHKGLKVGSYVVDQFGNITINEELADFVADKSTIIGLAFNSKARIMPIEAGAQFGNSHTGIKRVDTVTVRFYRSMGGSYSNPSGTMHDFEIPESSTLFSGLKKIAWNDSSSEEASVSIEQNDPYPQTVLLLVMRGETKE